MRQAGAELLDGSVDCTQAFLVGGGIGEIEFGEPGFEVWKGAAVEVVGCYAGVAVERLVW